MGYCGDIYFWRQNLIIISDSLHSIGIGLMLSFTSVLNPALLSKNITDIKASRNEASWLGSILGFSGMIGFCIFPFIMQTFGRKSIAISYNILNILGFVTYYYAKDISTMFVANFLEGLTTSGVTIGNIIIAEYIPAKRRGYCVVLKKTMITVGSLICHSLYFYWTWREIALFNIAPFVLSISITFLWPESPSYLALKGRYSECEKSHTWLFGSSAKTQQELLKLIQAQEERRKGREKSLKQRIVNVLVTFTRLDFLKPFLIVISLIMLLEGCGKYYMLIYIVQILIEVTGNKSVAIYCTIAYDIFSVVGLCTSSFLIGLMKRRTILFSFSIVMTALMYTLSFILFLRTKYNISFTWTTPTLITVTSFVLYVGIIPVTFSIMSEIIPLEHKGLGTFSTGIVFTGLFALTTKFTPVIMQNIGVGGMFAISGTFVMVSLILLYFILIETKDKTLQEIEDEVKGVKLGERVPNERIFVSD